MKFSGKVWLMIILNVTKTQGFTLSLKDSLFEKPQEGEGEQGRGQIDPPAVSGLNECKKLMVTYVINWNGHLKFLKKP